MKYASVADRRRTVITGAARGLGLAMADGLLEAGHALLIVDRDQSQIEAALNQLRSQGYADRAFAATVDLTSEDAAARVMDAAGDKLGGIDILVNNAGVGPGLVSKEYVANPPAFDELPNEMVRLFFQVNAIVPLLLAIHAARRMRAQGWGRIVNVTTSHDSMMRRGFVPYGGSKASLESHSAIMAQDLEGTGVTVNVLVPGGAADTDMIPLELGFDRSRLIRPTAMVAPLKWLVADSADPPNGRRVVAANWSADAAANGHPSVSAAGWEGTGGQAIIPTSHG